MQKIARKNNAKNPKKRKGDIPSLFNRDIEKCPGETLQDNPEIMPDIPQTLPEHPQRDGCGDESAGRKPARMPSAKK